MALAPTKISALPVATSIGVADLLPIVQSGETRQATGEMVKTLVGSVLRSFFIPAAAIRPSASSGCASIALATTSSNRPDVSSLDFDASTQEFAQFWIRMPKSWDEGTITASFMWSHAATTTNFGVTWGLQAVAVSDGDSMDTAYGTAQEVSDTGGTTNTLYKSAKTSAITIAGTPQAEDFIAFRVYRLPTDTNDTLAVDARLMGVNIFFSTNTTDET